MMFGASAAVVAVIAAVTSVVVTGLSLLLGDRQQRRREEQARRQDLNARYLNPLRLHLVESSYRLSDTVRQADAGGGRYEAALTVAEPAEISGKDATWFNGTGCALASSVYLTACLFAQLKKVRDDFPYLQLAAEDDTRLAALLLGVHQGYLAGLGVFYVTQPSIGQSMWAPGQNRLLTYREFCELLQDPGQRVWLDRLIQFHLDTATGHTQAHPAADRRDPAALELPGRLRGRRPLNPEPLASRRNRTRLTTRGRRRRCHRGMRVRCHRRAALDEYAGGLVGSAV
jgi:hypothetical protein